MKFPKRGYPEIITAAVMWGFVGIFVKMIHGMSAQSIIFYRVAFASIIFFIVLLISGNMKIIRLGDKKIYLVLFGIFQAITILMYFVSILKGSVSVAVLLLYTAPAYVTVLSPLLLKESSTRKGIVALFLSIAGILFIVNPDGHDFSRSLGIMAGILSGIAYALQIITSKHASSTYSGYTQAFWSFIIATLIFLPVGIAPTDIVFDNLLFLILLAIFPTILSVSLYYNGLKKVRAQSASILGLIEPLSAVTLAIFILGEKVSVLEIIGGVLILAGAALVMRES